MNPNCKTNKTNNKLVKFEDFALEKIFVKKIRLYSQKILVEFSESNNFLIEFYKESKINTSLLSFKGHTINMSPASIPSHNKGKYKEKSMIFQIIPFLLSNYDKENIYGQYLNNVNDKNNNKENEINQKLIEKANKIYTTVNNKIFANEKKIEFNKKDDLLYDEKTKKEFLNDSQKNIDIVQKNSIENPYKNFLNHKRERFDNGINSDKKNYDEYYFNKNENYSQNVILSSNNEDDDYFNYLNNNDKILNGDLLSQNEDIISYKSREINSFNNIKSDFNMDLNSESSYNKQSSLYF